jgi:hypothetical protein
VDYKDNLKRYPKSSVQWFKNLLGSSWRLDIWLALFRIAISSSGPGQAAISNHVYCAVPRSMCTCVGWSTPSCSVHVFRTFSGLLSISIQWQNLKMKFTCELYFSKK